MYFDSLLVLESLCGMEVRSRIGLGLGLIVGRPGHDRVTHIKAARIAPLDTCILFAQLQCLRERSCV